MAQTKPEIALKAHASAFRAWTARISIKINLFVGIAQIEPLNQVY